MDSDVFGRLRSLYADEASANGILRCLFERESTLLRGAMEADLSARDIACLCDLDLVRLAGDEYVPLARIDRIRGLLIASDLRGRRRQPDFVVEPGPASFLLAGSVRHGDPGRSLDLGCGSGIQSLLLASAGATVAAIDINSRALGFARFNAALNDFRDIALEEWDFLEGCADDRFDGMFDTVVANPPFVLAPEHQVLYRDRSLPGDQVGARTVEIVGRAMAPGGRGYVLCNWIDDGGGDWSERPRRWSARAGCDASVTRVAELTPADYAAIWTRDLPEPERGRAVAAWTAALDAEGARRVHVGVIAMGRDASANGSRQRFQAVDRGGAPEATEVEAFLGAERHASAADKAAPRRPWRTRAIDLGTIRRH